MRFPVAVLDIGPNRIIALPTRKYDASVAKEKRYLQCHNSYTEEERESSYLITAMQVSK